MTWNISKRLRGSENLRNLGNLWAAPWPASLEMRALEATQDITRLPAQIASFLNPDYTSVLINLIKIASFLQLPRKWVVEEQHAQDIQK